MSRGHAAIPSRGRRPGPRRRELGLLRQRTLPCWPGPAFIGQRRDTFAGWPGLAFTGQRRGTFTGWLGLAFTVWLGLAGCAASRAPTPVPATQRYLELTAGERPDAAYALLDESFRRRCDRPCFARLTASQREEARRALAELRTGPAPRVEQLVELALPDGSGLRLGQAEAPAVSADLKGAPSGGAYFFSQNPLEFYPQSTPQETVRSFARALHAQRYQALLRFVPRALAEQLTAEQLRARFEGTARAGLLAQLAALQKHWNEPFQVDGATARLPLGEGQEVRLVLEQGRWRLAQLQ